MKKFIQYVLIITTIAACHNKLSTPIPTEELTLAPVNRIQVYTDEIPHGRAIIRKSPVPGAGAGQVVTNTHTRDKKPAIINIPGKSEQQDTPGHIDTAIHKSITKTPAALPENTDSSDARTTTVAGAANSGIDTSSMTVPVAKERKKWNNASKGVVIGGVGGAIGGAIISKKKAKGAIIGGVIGATGGYIFGKTKDNKEKQNDTH